MQMIHTKNSNNAKGHYSPAVIHNGIAYISGQLPLDYANEGAQPTGSIEEQAQKALQNIEFILNLCKSKKENVLKITVYISDISYWPKVNKIYGEFFGSHKPARTIVPTTTLHFGALIEIEAIASIDEN